MICKYCKNEIKDNSKFCGYCGKKVDKPNVDLESDKNTVIESSKATVTGKTKKSKRLLISIIASVCVILSIGGAITFILLNNKGTADDSNVKTTESKNTNSTIDNKSNNLENEYKEYIKDTYAPNAEAGSQIQVGFYDINDDGVTEAIVSSGKSEADWQCSVHSYEDDEVYLVDSIYGHYDFYKAESGEGLYIVTGHQGFETIKRLTMNKSGDKLITQTISEKSLDPDEDYYSNDYPVEFTDLTREFEDY